MYGFGGRGGFHGGGSLLPSDGRDARGPHSSLSFGRANLLAKRTACLLGCLVVVDLVTSSLVAAGAVCGFDERCLAAEFSDAYNLRTSIVDVLAIDTARALALALILVGPAALANAAWWAVLGALLLALCKGVVLSGEPPAQVAAFAPRVALVVVAIALAAAELFASRRLLSLRARVSSLRARRKAETRADGSAPSAADAEGGRPAGAEGGKPFSVWGFLLILKPYFYPAGCKHKLVVLSTLAVVVGAKVSNLLAPVYIGKAAQRLSDEGVVPYRELALLATFRFSSVALSNLQGVVYLGVKQHAFAELACSTFAHLHTLSLDWHLRKKMGQVIRVMDRGIGSADTVVNFLVLRLIPSFIEGGITFAIFYVTFRSPELSATAFLSFVVYIILTIQISTWRKQFQRAKNANDNKYHDLATDSLVNFETVKYFANEQLEGSQFKAAVTKFQSYSVSTQASLAFLNVTQGFDIHLTTMIGLCIAATTILHQYGKGGAPAHIGDFVAVNAYLVQLFAPLSVLGSIYSAVVQSFVDMGNLSDLLTEKPDVRDLPGAPPLRLLTPQRGASIDFRDVSFAYPTQPTKGIRGLTFSCAPGSSTALVGPTGSGKTTVSRLLFRFYDTASGTVSVDGQDIMRVTQRSLRQAIGVVPQDTVLFNASIEENIRYGKPDATHSELEAAAKSAQILDFVLSLDGGWSAVVGERGLRISGGEKQRVAIARCLLKDPPICVLDEATSALDSATEGAVQEALTTLGRGRTQLSIAHRLSTIMGSNLIIVLDGGRAVERGSHDDLLSARGAYHRLWVAQQEGERAPAASLSNAEAGSEASESPRSERSTNYLERGRGAGAVVHYR